VRPGSHQETAPTRRSPGRGRAAAGLLAFVLAGLAALPAPAANEDGRRFATRWCSSCHAVAPGQKRLSDGVPSFAEIAGRKNSGRGALKAFLSTPHPRMPDMSLTRAEIDALVDYIRSQKR
jgi:mono/diheme cytochrome c family protein